MKITIRPYKSNAEPQIGDKAIFNDFIVEMRYPEVVDSYTRKGDEFEPCKKQTDQWIFTGKYGSSSNNFGYFKRPFDEYGNLLPIEMWEKVIEEMKNDRIILINE